jgi:hypothetical protein
MTPADVTDPFSEENMNIYSYLEHIAPVFKDQYLKSVENGCKDESLKLKWSACIK